MVTVFTTTHLQGQKKIQLHLRMCLLKAVKVQISFNLDMSMYVFFILRMVRCEICTEHSGCLEEKPWHHRLSHELRWPLFFFLFWNIIFFFGTSSFKNDWPTNYDSSDSSTWQTFFRKQMQENHRVFIANDKT